MNQILGKDYTVRTDRFGNEIKVTRGYLYKVGSNQKGIAYNPSSTTKEDAYGQLHEIPKGHRASEREDGSLSVVGDGETPQEPKQSSRQRPPSFEKPAEKMSQLEAVKLSAELRSPFWQMVQALQRLIC